jgi:PE-PPE domain/PE family
VAECRLRDARHDRALGGGKDERMTYVLTQPQAMAAAAADAAGIGAAINEANAAAAGPTTRLLAAAADEVSAPIAKLFSSYAQEYQAIIKRAGVFHTEFAQLLAAAGNGYAETEAAAKATFAEPRTTPVAISLIMGGTDMPTPPPQYLNAVYNSYISPNFTTTNLQGLTAPEQLYPLTGIKSLTLQQSLSQGVTILNNAIMQDYRNGITPINVFGYSQSAVIASLEMPILVAAGVPSADVNFVLLGDPMNPNGGLFARFPGQTIPGLGATFYGATPANDYPTVVYTGEYDGFADFPRYPIDVLADLNALMGVIYVHNACPTFTAAQVASAVQLPTSGPTTTTYYMIPTQNLPLLDPVRAIPYIGNPLADLLQPDLTYLVNWGYGNPAYGYSTGPANVDTPVGFLPPRAATTALGPDLVSGTQQGIAAAADAFHAEGFAFAASPSLWGISHAVASAIPAAPSMALPDATSMIDGIISSL